MMIEKLNELKCEDIIIRQRGRLGISVGKVECDFYEWMKGKPQALNAYRGEYMSQYSWSEFTHGAME